MEKYGMKVEEMNTETYEELAIKVLLFLKKWGSGGSVLTNGNKYYCSEGSSYKGIPGIAVEPDVDASEECTSTWVMAPDFPGDEPTVLTEDWGGPVHKFDVKLSEEMAGVLNDFCYRINLDYLSDETIKEIMEGKGVFDEAVEKIYGVKSIEDLCEKINSGGFDELGYREEDPLEIKKEMIVDELNERYNEDDPLEYDTYEEYLEMNNYNSDGVPRYTRYGTYEEYLEHANEDFYDECADVMVEIKEIEPLWERMVADAKEKYFKKWKEENKWFEDYGCIAGSIESEFWRVFSDYPIDMEMETPYLVSAE